MKPGDRVRMSEELKAALKANGSGPHVREFGKCVGVIAERADEHEPVCWDVRWEPSRLRYFVPGAISGKGRGAAEWVACRVHHRI